MISSSGKYYLGLDHVRAVAAFLVFTWHFIHVRDGQLAPPPVFPLSLLAEGHTGVALFVTLSGYLFAKLLDGKDINYVAFLWNRFLRLGPLLIVIGSMIAIRAAVASGGIGVYAGSVLRGELPLPLPSGFWSIFVEFNFYLALPVLLYLTRKSKYALLPVLAAVILLRALYYIETGGVQWWSYWTIAGRIDQFLLGITAFHLRGALTGRHLPVLAFFGAFLVVYWWFDTLGGFYGNGGYPSPSPVWIWLPALEGAAYAAMIAWYDNSFRHPAGPISRFIALIGTYSYSIYLLRFYLVFQLARFIDERVLDLSNLHLAMPVSPFAFLLLMPLGYLSYRFIESPFLKLRTPYIASPNTTRPEAATGGI